MPRSGVVLNTTQYNIQHNTAMERQEVALILEQEFMSFEDFKHAMDKWAIDGGFTFFYQI